MRNKILQYLETIPALSPTIAKIVELSESQSTSASNLVQAIKLDPVLTLKILKLINSAYFSMPSHITSINRAIVLLGMNTIKNVALSAEVLSSFNPKGGTHFDVEKFWEHSLACAVASKLLAQESAHNREKHEDYFIAGLIHDIGKIFIIKYFPAEYFSACENAASYQSLLQEEKKIFSVDHAEIGALISEKWALPDELIASVKFHHSIGEYEGDSIMPAAVYLSNYYCNMNGYESSTGLIPSDIMDEDDWENIHIEKGKAEEILSILDERVEEARVFIKT